jgi:hypothetical protein
MTSHALTTLHRMHTSPPLFHEEAPALSPHTPRRACQTTHRRQTLVMGAAGSLMVSRTTLPLLPTRTRDSPPFRLTPPVAVLAADERDILPSAAFWPSRRVAVLKLSAHDKAVTRRDTFLFFPFTFRAAFGIQHSTHGPNREQGQCHGL